MAIDMNVDNKITDEVLAKAKERLGEVVQITGGFNSEAQLDTIRHFAEGIGDDNPLWLEPSTPPRPSTGPC